MTPDAAILFTTEQAGRNRLSEQTKILMPKVTGIGGVMPDFPGNAPVAENFADSTTARPAVQSGAAVKSSPGGIVVALKGLVRV